MFSTIDNNRGAILHIRQLLGTFQSGNVAVQAPSFDVYFQIDVVGRAFSVVRRFGDACGMTLLSIHA
jgi:hypothetical protein